METSAGTPKKSSNKLVVIIAGVVVAVAVGAAAAVTMSGQNSQPEEDNSLKIGYSADAKVMLDEDSLQAEVKKALEESQNSNVALKYQNDAFSENGKDFTCRILNSSANPYDMFLTIYADGELTDQLFLSELVPPGSGFEEITLDRALEPGDHTVYVALTQVTLNEEGEQVIKNQVVHTMDFHVTPPDQSADAAEPAS